MKKFLAMVLCAAMLLSLMSMTAATVLAEDLDDWGMEDDLSGDLDDLDLDDLDLDDWDLEDSEEGIELSEDDLMDFMALFDDGEDEEIDPDAYVECYVGDFSFDVPEAWAVNGLADDSWESDEIEISDAEDWEMTDDESEGPAAEGEDEDLPAAILEEDEALESVDDTTQLLMFYPSMITYLQVSAVSEEYADFEAEAMHDELMAAYAGEDVEIKTDEQVKIAGMDAYWIDLVFEESASTVEMHLVLVLAEDSAIVFAMEELGDCYEAYLVDILKSLKYKGEGGETDISAAVDEDSLVKPELESLTFDLSDLFYSDEYETVEKEVIEAEAIEGEAVLNDCDEYTLTLQGIDEDGMFGYEMTFALENKSASCMSLYTSGISVNGCVIESSYMSCMVDPGETETCELTIYESDLEKYQIDSIEEIQIEASFMDEDTWLTFAMPEFVIYPEGKDAVSDPDLQIPEGAKTLVDEDGIRVAVLEAGMTEDDFLGGYSVTFFLANDTDMSLYFGNGDETVLNGEPISIFWGMTISSGKKAISTLTIYDSELEYAGIENVDSFDFNLTVQNNEDWLSDALIDESFTIQ